MLFHKGTVEQLSKGFFCNSTSSYKCWLVSLEYLGNGTVFSRSWSRVSLGESLPYNALVTLASLLFTSAYQPFLNGDSKTIGNAAEPFMLRPLHTSSS